MQYPIYNERSYRKCFRNDRWRGFVVKHKDSDLWIGIDKNSYLPAMRDFCFDVLTRIRDSMEKYLETDPGYTRSLVPYRVMNDAPRILESMSQVSFQTGIGPMSAVAGAVSLFIADAIKKEFAIREIIIENGGDIYAEVTEDIDIAVFAGTSPLSEKVGLHIDAKDTPLGISTSSGTVGHALSFGNADAVMVVCKDAALSDSYATYFGNRIKKADDIAIVIEEIKENKAILAALLIKEDKMGITGKFELKLFK